MKLLQFVFPTYGEKIGCQVAILMHKNVQEDLRALSSCLHDCILLDKWWHNSPFKRQLYIQVSSSAQYKDAKNRWHDILLCWPRLDFKVFGPFCGNNSLTWSQQI